MTYDVESHLPSSWLWVMCDDYGVVVVPRDYAHSLRRFYWQVLRVVVHHLRVADAAMRRLSLSSIIRIRIHG
jgi:hypothetical protein